MSAISMDDIKKLKRKDLIKFVGREIQLKANQLSKQTYRKLQNQFEDLSLPNQKSKNGLIKLATKIKELEPYISSTKRISASAIKKIKGDEKNVIMMNKKKLNSFLKSSKKVLSFYATFYAPSVNTTDNTIYYHNSPWNPVSGGMTRYDVRSHYLEMSSIKTEYLFSKLKKFEYVSENDVDSFMDTIKDFNEFQEFESNYATFSQSADILIRVFDVSLSKAIDQPMNYAEDFAYDDGSNLHLANQYIKTDLLQNYYSSSYVQNNFLPRSCWLSLLLEIYKEPVEKYLKKTKLTYESIHEIISDGPLNKESNGYSFNQVVKFFQKFKLGLYMFDIAFNIVNKYEPERRNKDINPEYLYVIFHNGHIYHLNHDLHKLSHKLDAYIEKPVVTSPSDKYSLFKHKEIENKVQIIHSFDDLKSIILDCNLSGDINLFYNHSCLDLWMRLRTDLKYEAIVRMKDCKLNFDTIVLKNINEKNIVISTYSEVGVNIDKTFETETMLHNYLEKKSNVLDKLLNRNYISNYSEQFSEMIREYSCGPLIGSFEMNYEKIECIEIDFNKYYTSILRDILKFPVINSFDLFAEYKGQAIDDYSLYFVEKKNYDIVYPINLFSLCYGMNIKDCLENLNIISFLVPSKLKVNISSGIIDDVYSDETLTEKMKKDIFNHAIGMFNKSSNKNTFTAVSDSREEANKLRKEYTGRIIPIHLEEEKVYMNYVEARRETIDGFKMISHLIYDIANKRLFDLKKKVEMAGIKVLKCNTDCLMLEKDDDKFKTFYDANRDMFHPTDIGKLKVKDKKVGCSRLLEIKRYDNMYQSIRMTSQKEHILKDEWDRDEIYKVIDKSNRLIIKADIAGAGKTSALLNYSKSFDKNALFVCPWNSLCCGLKKDGVQAITLDRLIGLRFDGESSKEGKGFDVAEYDMIVFDEIYLYDTYKLERIRTFMDTHEEIKFYATGDEHQNKPIETLNIQNPKGYYNKIISDMFDCSITLHENKRCVTKEDQEKIKLITSSIRNANSKADALEILMSNFKIIYDKKDIVNSKNVVALNRTAEWVNSLVHKPFEGEVYYEGLHLICRKSYKDKKTKFYVNYTYEILDIQNTMFRLSDGENIFFVERKLIESNFRLSYARTCHSYQGLSESEAITIFDVTHFMVDVDWIYTAITRCTSLSNVSIYMGKTDYDENIAELRTQIRKMIDGHKHSDQVNDRLIKGDYVNIPWTLNELKKSNKCSECNKHLDVSKAECFSIDRIDNNLGHYQFNCRIICRRCNNAKK